VRAVQAEKSVRISGVRKSAGKSRGKNEALEVENQHHFQRWRKRTIR